MVPVVRLRNRGVHTHSIRVLKEVVLKEVENVVSSNFKSKEQEQRQSLSQFFLSGRSCRENKLTEVPINDGVWKRSL
jgi:hypothetical protein